MIYALRLLAFGDSADELEKQFDVMIGHFANVGRLEGIVPDEVRWGEAESVIESLKPSEEIRIGNHRYAPRYKGRRTIEFSTFEGDFEPLLPRPQPGYEVALWNPEGSELVPQPPSSVVVVERLMPMVGEELPGAPGFSLAHEKIGPFEITVYESITKVLPGWVILRCSVCHTEVGEINRTFDPEGTNAELRAVTSSIGERMVFETTVRVEEQRDEIDRLMAAARLYVKQAQGLTGDDRIDTMKAMSAFVVGRSGTKVGSCQSAEDYLDAIRGKWFVREVKVALVPIGRDPVEKGWCVTAAIADENCIPSAVQGWESATRATLIEAARDVHGKVAALGYAAEEPEPEPSAVGTQFVQGSPSARAGERRAQRDGASTVGYVGDGDEFPPVTSG